MFRFNKKVTYQYMKSPHQDLSRRQKMWDALQMFFMDTESDIFYADLLKAKKETNYSTEEIKLIFFNEVYPALKNNLSSITGEWKGYKIEDLSEKILVSHRFGKRLPIKFFNLTAWSIWKDIEAYLTKQNA